MANDVTLPLTGSGDATAKAATDETAGRHYQIVKLADGTEDGEDRIAGSAANGLEVDVTRVQGTVEVDASGTPVPVTDNGGALTIDDGGSTISVDDGGGALTVDGTVTANAGTGTRTVAGDVAHDAADSGNPVGQGLSARTTNPTAVADGDRVRAIADDIGRQVVVPFGVRDLIDHQLTQIVNSTSETTIVTAPGAGVFADLLCLVITNQTATPVAVTIKDATGGTNRMRYALHANGGVVLMFPAPVPQKAGANNNWTATLSVNTVAVDIFALFVKNV